MSKSDYLLKAAIKTVAEKLNKIFVDKIEEASNIAQDVPEIIQKEFDALKDSIIEEAIKMEKNIKNENPTNSKINQDPNIIIALEEIQFINKQIDEVNKEMNN